VYLCLKRHTDKKGHCYPSLNTIAQKCGISRSTVIRTIYLVPTRLRGNPVPTHLPSGRDGTLARPDWVPTPARGNQKKKISSFPLRLNNIYYGIKKIYLKPCKKISILKSIAYLASTSVENLSNYG
jgi:hypothetical protein